MRFGEKLQALRKAKGYTLRDLAAKVGVGFTYISKAENGKLAFADFPGEALIVKLAKALDADTDELLIMAKKIPEAFRKLAGLDDEALDKLIQGVDREDAKGHAIK
jgi:transcriptional regulator with XRE-family HTH domain